MSICYICISNRPVAQAQFHFDRRKKKKMYTEFNTHICDRILVFKTHCSGIECPTQDICIIYQFTSLLTLWLQNHGVGRLKRNLFFYVEYHGIWHNFTEIMFLCRRGTCVWGKLHGGKQFWVAQQAPPQTELPYQNNVSMAKQLRRR